LVVMAASRVMVIVLGMALMVRRFVIFSWQ
jgi:hypothetical protein